MRVVHKAVKRTIVKVSILNPDIKTGGHNYSRDESIGNPAYWMDGVRHRDGASSIQALERNCGNSRRAMKREKAK